MPPQPVGHVARSGPDLQRAKLPGARLGLGSSALKEEHNSIEVTMATVASHRSFAIFHRFESAREQPRASSDRRIGAACPAAFAEKRRQLRESGTQNGTQTQDAPRRHTCRLARNHKGTSNHLIVVVV